MGRLIKNHLARLITMSAALYQIIAAVFGLIWPKAFWDFLTKSFDAMVRPAPILQLSNLIFVVLIIALEWPYYPVAGTMVHRSLITRLVLLFGAAFVAALMYQSTDVTIYYIIGICLYTLGYNEGETISAEPWTVEEARSGRVQSVEIFNSKLGAN